MFGEGTGHAKKEKPRVLYSCVSCQRIPELTEVNGFFTEEEVVKFKLRKGVAMVDWGKDLVEVVVRIKHCLLQRSQTDIPVFNTMNTFTLAETKCVWPSVCLSASAPAQ